MRKRSSLTVLQSCGMCCTVDTVTYGHTLRLITLHFNNSEHKAQADWRVTHRNQAVASSTDELLFIVSRVFTCWPTVIFMNMFRGSQDLVMKIKRFNCLRTLGIIVRLYDKNFCRSSITGQHCRWHEFCYVLPEKYPPSPTFYYSHNKAPMNK